MFKHALGVLFLLMAALTAFSAGPTMSLVVPSDPVPAGEELLVSLVILNPTMEEQGFQLPSTVEARVQGKYPVTLRHNAQDASDVLIKPQGFYAGNYSFVIPGELSGQVVIESMDGSLRAVLVVESPGETKPIATAEPTEKEAPVKKSAFARGTVTSWIDSGFAQRFSAHEPMYFIYGYKDPVAKFQFSLKYHFFEDEGKVGKSLPVLRRLYFGYTQRTLWDIESDSSPFYDTSYMPELFIEMQRPVPTDKDQRWFWMGYQAGVQHESNGKGGSDSRSLNTVYLRTALLIGNIEGWRVIVVPKIFGYIGDMSDNPDLREYRGYGELVIRAGKHNSLELTARGRLGSDGDKGSLQFDLSYPIKDRNGNPLSYILLQYFNGYGESLLDYNRRSSSMLRLGIAFVR